MSKKRGPSQDFKNRLTAARAVEDRFAGRAGKEPDHVTLVRSIVANWGAGQSLEYCVGLLEAVYPGEAQTIVDVVFQNLPYLENLISMHGHNSVVLRHHMAPCGQHDFCLMRQAQKGADAIRAALESRTKP